MPDYDHIKAAIRQLQDSCDNLNKRIDWLAAAGETVADRVDRLEARIRELEKARED